MLSFIVFIHSVVQMSDTCNTITPDLIESPISIILMLLISKTSSNLHFEVVYAIV